MQCPSGTTTAGIGKKSVADCYPETAGRYISLHSPDALQVCPDPPPTTAIAPILSEGVAPDQGWYVWGDDAAQEAADLFHADNYTARGLHAPPSGDPMVCPLMCESAEFKPHDGEQNGAGEILCSCANDKEVCA